MSPFAISIVAFVASVVLGYVVSMLTGSLGQHSDRNVVPLTIYGKREAYVLPTHSGPAQETHRE